MCAEANITKPESIKSGRRWAVLLPVGLVVVAAAAVAAVVAVPAPEEKIPPVEAVPVNVTVEVVAGVPDLPDTFSVTAVVEPDQVVDVAAEVAGQVERYGARTRSIVWRGKTYAADTVVAEGEPIAKGDPIVHLDRELFEAAVKRAQAQLAYDRSEYERVLGLFGNGSASQSELNSKQTHRDISQATLDEARKLLDSTIVTAPIDGVLNALPLDVGEYAQSGMRVGQIVDISRAKVVVDVPERDVHYLSLGDTVRIGISTPQSDAFAGEITYISELADGQSKTTRVEVTVDNGDQRLRSGQIVRATLTRRMLHDVVMVPLASVIPLEDGYTVYVVDDGNRAQERRVTLGVLQGRRVRIVDGLEAGDRLIVAGHRYVSPGQAVTVIEERPQL